MQRIGFMVALLLSCAVQAGPVYKWTDEKGRVHYGDRPAANAKKLDVGPPGAAQAAAPATPDQALECQRKKDQLQTYQNAARVIERDSLGNEKEFTEAEKQKLIAVTQAQIARYCGTPQAAAEPPPPPPAAEEAAPDNTTGGV